MAFGDSAVIDGEFQMSTEERIKHSLVNPGARGAMTIPNVNKITKARIQYNLTLLAHELHSEVVQWIRDVASTNPAKGVELYMQFLEFSVPKLKSVEVTQNGGAPLRELSLDELNRMANETNNPS